MPHGAEMPYAFDTLGAGPGGSPPPEDQAVARTVNTYWANFAKTGDPNGGPAEMAAQRPRKNEILELRPDGSPAPPPIPESAAGRDRAGRQAKR